MKRENKYLAVTILLLVLAIYFASNNSYFIGLNLALISVCSILYYNKEKNANIAK